MRLIIRAVVKRRSRVNSLGLALVIILQVIAGALIVSQHPASATTSNNVGFAVSPPTFELSANPGDTIKQSIRVDNLTDTSLALDIDRKDFMPIGEEGQATLTDKRTSYSLASWIETSDKSLLISPRGSSILDFTIKVPVGAEPGGHFGSIVLRSMPGGSGNQTGTIVGQEIGSLILLKVAGQVTEKAEIASFSATKGVWEHGKASFSLRLKNKGNVQIKPTGTVTVSNVFGRNMGSAPVDSRTVLPDSTRKLGSTWSGSSWPGWYTATASVSYGSSGKILTRTTRFVIFPYRIVIPVLVAFAVLGLFLFRIRRRLLKAVRILAGKE